MTISYCGTFAIPQQCHSIRDSPNIQGSPEDNANPNSAVDPKELSRAASEVAATHCDLRAAYEIAHDIAVYANDMMVAGRINGFNVRVGREPKKSRPRLRRRQGYSILG